MASTRTQLAEVEELIAASPDDTTLHTLRDDLLQLIALEQQTEAGHGLTSCSAAGAVCVGGAAMGAVNGAATSTKAESHILELSSASSVAAASVPSKYLAQGTFTEHNISSSQDAFAVAEAPDLAPFQPVRSAGVEKPIENGDEARDQETKSRNTEPSTTSTTQTTEKKKKKKKSNNGETSNNNESRLDVKFELPPHLILLDSDTPAQKLKKQRTAKALKSKFREKQKEMEHERRQNDWKSFAMKGDKGGKSKGRLGGVWKRNALAGSIFATEEGVNAKVGVISGGGGGRKMTDAERVVNKRHKFH